MNDLNTTCRSCGSIKLSPVLSLGTTPLADALLTKEQLGQPEMTAPLDVVFCASCTLVQITQTISPEILFCQDYPYYSSVSPKLLKHFAQSAKALIASRDLNSKSLVVEAASNDGYMLKNFSERNIPVLGIDPAEGPARVAKEAGIPTRCTFFGKDLAGRLKEEGRGCDVFLANNVLAHVPDLNGFVEGISIILKKKGVAVIEVPYLVDLINHCEFDTIYHQHLCYFSVTALDNLFRRHKLFLNDIQRTSIHGGSLRLFVERREAVSDAVHYLLREERRAGMTHREYYSTFADRVRHVRASLMNLLSDLKGYGMKIAGYGAAAKATTFLSQISRSDHWLTSGESH